VAGMTAQEIMDNLSDRMSGKRVIAALAAAMNDATRQSRLLTWDPARFTDPHKHRMKEFRYLIHGLRRETDIGLASAPPARRNYVRLNLGAWIDDGTGNMRTGQYYLENPDIVSKSLLSCSVITQDKTETYADMYFGFILRVPKENIGAASPQDMNMGFDKATRPDMLAGETDARVRMAIIGESFIDGVASLYQMDLPTLDNLITQTTAHNEIAVIGLIGGSKVTVSGLFLKVSSKSMLPAEFDKDEELWSIGKYIRGCAEKLGVPIVPIPDAKVDAAAGESWFPGVFGG
jgi:hypothetical protein